MGAGNVFRAQPAPLPIPRIHLRKRRSSALHEQDTTGKDVDLFFFFLFHCSHPAAPPYVTPHNIFPMRYLWALRWMTAPHCAASSWLACRISPFPPLLSITAAVAARRCCPRTPIVVQSSRHAPHSCPTNPPFYQPRRGIDLKNTPAPGTSPPRFATGFPPALNLGKSRSASVHFQPPRQP